MAESCCVDPGGRIRSTPALCPSASFWSLQVTFARLKAPHSPLTAGNFGGVAL